LENQRQANKFNTTQVPITVAPATPKPSVEIPRSPEAPAPVIAEIIPQKPETPIAGKSFRDKLKDGSLGPEMVWIPAGTFQMGSDNEEINEKPVHTVSVRSFAMGKYEVTFEEYDKFCEATGQSKPDDKGWGRGKRPVTNVTWDNAKAYVKWLSEQTKKNYHLPSESQWEYACRAGSSDDYSFGNSVGELDSYGWHSLNAGGGSPRPVGMKKPNIFGLYDIHGNVWEWLEDVWHSNYDNAPTDGSPWVSGGESNTHLLRSGSTLKPTFALRCARRSKYDSTDRYFDVGFRISRM